VTYKLFLDDERFPRDYDEDWVIARTFDDAVWYVEARGVPQYIAFDHDLGLGRNGYDFAKWLCDHININSVEVPENFMFQVHSMNPVGAKNIKLYMKNFLRHYYANRKSDEG
jgi:hypothetical protein